MWNCGDDTHVTCCKITSQINWKTIWFPCNNIQIHHSGEFSHDDTTFQANIVKCFFQKWPTVSKSSMSTLIFSWKKPPSIDLPKVCSTMVSSITSSWACWRYAWSSIDNHYMRLVMCLSVSSTHKLNYLHSSNYRQHYLFATQLFSVCLFQDKCSHSREISVPALTCWMSNVSVSLVHFQLWASFTLLLENRRESRVLWDSHERERNNRGIYLICLPSVILKGIVRSKM